MKKEVVLASHGGLSQGIKNSAEMILGTLPFPCEVYSLLPGHSPDEFSSILRERVRSNPDTEFDIVADLYGASVASSLYPLSQYSNVHLFTGMNLNLVLSLFVEHPDALEEKDEDQIIRDAREGVRKIVFEPEVSNDDF